MVSFPTYPARQPQYYDDNAENNAVIGKRDIVFLGNKLQQCFNRYQTGNKSGNKAYQNQTDIMQGEKIGNVSGHHKPLLQPSSER